MREQFDPNVKRGFNAYILQSLYGVIHACTNSNTDMIKRMVIQLRLQIPSDKLDMKKYKEDKIMFNVMNALFPISQTILHLIVFHLPLPAQA